MAFDNQPEFLSRRAFLRNTALGAAGWALLSSEAFGEEKSPYTPFKMGIQSYSLRAFKTEDALAKTKALGLKFWEAYPAHFALTDDPKLIAVYKEQLKAYDIRLWTYGVIDFKNDEADARRKFEFAKAMDIRVLSAYPSLDSFDLLDKLVDEYKIAIAIHNHGPGDKLYDKMEKERKALEGHHVLIGACEDTGHRLRSDENPVEAVKLFGKRVYGVHLKDVKTASDGGKQFTELGKGALDTVGLLQTLKANKFANLLSLEYEEHENAPIPYIEECLASTREAIQKLK